MTCSFRVEETQGFCGAFMEPRFVSATTAYTSVTPSISSQSRLRQCREASCLKVRGSPGFLSSCFTGRYAGCSSVSSAADTGRHMSRHVHTPRNASATFAADSSIASTTVSLFKCPSDEPRRRLLSSTMPSLMNAVPAGTPASDGRACPRTPSPAGTAPGTDTARAS